MKRTIILCLSILLIALTGCKKDKNSWGKLEEGAIAIKVGETKQLTFTHDGNKFPQWTSDNENVATVDANGVVTGVRVGTAYVSVNGLQCKVTVTDDYMQVVEPFQNWEKAYDEAEEYMIQMLQGNITIPELTHDTLHILEVDSTEIEPGVFNRDTIVDTVVVYVSNAKYVLEATLEGQFVDEYEYTFTYDTKKFVSSMTKATMTINAAHVSEIPTYLNNRYVETSSKYYKVTNLWELDSHIYDKSPVIVFSKKAIAEN